MFEDVEVGDRVEVTNVKGLKVVGIYTEKWDGVLGHIRLGDGERWPFAFDAKVVKTVKELSETPENCKETESQLMDFVGNISPSKSKSWNVKKKKHINSRVDLNKNRDPEMKRKIFSEIRKLLEEGLSVFEISRRIGVSDCTVYRYRDKIRKWKENGR